MELDYFFFFQLGTLLRCYPVFEQDIAYTNEGVKCILTNEAISVSVDLFEQLVNTIGCSNCPLGIKGIKKLFLTS